MVWIDDPFLEMFVDSVLNTKMLVLEVLNFTADYVSNTIESPDAFADTTDCLHDLCHDLYFFFPDYGPFLVPAGPRMGEG